MRYLRLSFAVVGVVVISAAAALLMLAVFSVTALSVCDTMTAARNPAFCERLAVSEPYGLYDHLSVAILIGTFSLTAMLILRRVFLRKGRSE